MFSPNICSGSMQFNTIYINNISKEIDQSIVDAISTTSLLDQSNNSDTIPDRVHSLITNTGTINPYFILNGPCEWFASWSDTRINFSRHTEVYFFLYEVLTVWQNHSRYNCPVGSIEKDCIINEFEMIDTWCKKHNVSKYKIFTNEYRMKEQLQQTKYANWAIYPLDTFSLSYSSHKRQPSQGAPYEIKHKLNCFTYRWDQHRHSAVAILHDIMPEDSVMTHFHNTDDCILKYPLDNSKYFKSYTRGCNDLMNHLPLVVDEPIETKAVSMREWLNPGTVTINNIGTVDPLEDAYWNSFASVVCETNYEYPWGQISEKTINPMKQGSPILLLAGPHSLELLQQWGLKTFHEFWDEGYDNELDPVKRMDKVFDIVTDISNLSYHELEVIKKHMKPLLVHNRNLIRTGEMRNNIIKALQ